MITTNDIDALAKAKVVDRDGDKVGSVGQVYVSDDGAQPLFVTVNTGLFGTHESFVPLRSADFSDGELRVAYDKATIKNAPNVDADGSISDDEQGSIFDYYDGHAGGTASGTRGSTTGLTDADRSTTTGLDRDASLDRDATRDLDTDRGTVGHDTSGPTTDDAMTRSEERLRVGTQQVETDRVRLRKHVVTEQQTVTVPVSHEEVRLEREPITEANRGDALDGPDLSEEEHEVVLTEERPVVQKETVPVERVRLDTDTVTEQQRVTEDVAHEEIDVDGADRSTR
ncbi:YsnF/AvaK domain-containing protein [uncultured Amnibacterium sp.]|uniref:YsnF/AvaK domain-containing protein n=1 Tax=uncultured Amnibacterium sp. TaxID=1631851 RepID=UPI0035C95AF5